MGEAGVHLGVSGPPFLGPRAPPPGRPASAAAPALSGRRSACLCTYPRPHALGPPPRIGLGRGLGQGEGGGADSPGAAAAASAAAAPRARRGARSAPPPAPGAGPRLLPLHPLLSSPLNLRLESRNRAAAARKEGGFSGPRRPRPSSLTQWKKDPAV